MDILIWKQKIDHIATRLLLNPRFFVPRKFLQLLSFVDLMLQTICFEHFYCSNLTTNANNRRRVFNINVARIRFFISFKDCIRIWHESIATCKTMRWNILLRMASQAVHITAVQRDCKIHVNKFAVCLNENVYICRCMHACSLFRYSLQFYSRLFYGFIV